MIGLGLIGSIWARHYLEDGILAASWNRTPKPDLDLNQASLEDCAKRSDVLHLCVYDPESVSETLTKLLPFLEARHTIIQSSTIDSASAESFQDLVRSKGANYVEAPFTGSKGAAEVRKTVFFLGGDLDAVKRVEPILKRISRQSFVIGSPGQAAAIKLSMNMQIANITQALSESISLARASGIADSTFFEVMKQNVSWSGVSEMKEDMLRNEEFAPHFSVKNLLKDMRLARKTASQALPQLDGVIECLEKTQDLGSGPDDFISMIKAYQSTEV